MEWAATNVLNLRSEADIDAATLEAMRAYLGRVDPMGGYFPALALPEVESSLWVRFWFVVRRLDDIVDAGGFEGLPELEAALWDTHSDADFAVALRSFLRDADGYMDAKRLFHEMFSSFLREREFPRGVPPTADELFRLFYFKCYLPAYVGFRLLFLKEDEATIQPFSMWFGSALQFSDDLFDLHEDLASGRLWITREELEVLGLDASDCGRHARELSDLREAVCLQHHLAAHALAGQMRARESRRNARCVVEYAFRLHLDGHFRVAPGGNTAWERNLRLIARAPGSEALKHSLVRTGIATLGWLPVTLADVGEVRALLARRPECPAALHPDRCRAVMSRLGDPARRAAATGAQRGRS